MKILKVLTIALSGLGFALLSSCGCCTSEPPAPELRPAPNFAPVIDHGGK